ncbi:MAG: DNA/RNA helicase domain-containing protein [Clostridia bacterium]
MIKLITGAKGTGKTKIIIDMANDNVADTNGGDIIFVTDTDRYMPSLSNQIRKINANDIKRASDGFVSEDALIGFIEGILAANHDVETLYIDGAHRMMNKSVAEMEDFFTDIYSISKSSDTNFVLTVSENEENFPEYLKRFQGAL